MKSKKVDTELYSEFDLRDANFDGYFDWHVKQMSQEQRNKIPDALRNKLISRSSGQYRPEKLKFTEKIFLLQRAFDRQWHLVIEASPAQEGVLDIDHYSMYKKEGKLNEMTSSEANLLLSKGAFVLSDRNLTNWLFHLNDVCVSGAYNFGLKIRNVKPQNMLKERKDIVYFLQILMAYEGNKCRIMRDFGITVVDMQVLFYLYDGAKKKGSPLYETVLTNAVNVNKRNVLASFRKLVDRKYILKFGMAQNTEYSITSFGISIVNDILVKYVTP